MVDIIILAIAPASIALFNWWARFLPVMILGTVAIYVLFIWFAFSVPLQYVAGVWIAYAIALVPFQMLRFPGQYNGIRRFLPNLYAWPLIAMATGIAEQVPPIVTEVDPATGRITTPFDVPGTIEGEVSFIETVGLEVDYIMVILTEFEGLVFYTMGSLESEDGMHEGTRCEFEIEWRRIEQLEQEVLWINEATRVRED